MYSTLLRTAGRIHSKKYLCKQDCGLCKIITIYAFNTKTVFAKIDFPKPITNIEIRCALTHQGHAKKS